MTAISEKIGYQNRLEQLQNLALPVYAAFSGTINLPSTEKSPQGVLENIKQIGIIRLSSNRHALVDLPNPLSHQPNGNSKTLWITEIDNNRNFVDWSTNTWRKIIEDTEFCDKLAGNVNIEMANGKTLYLYFGYKENKKGHMYSGGPQTLSPPHMHLVDSFDGAKPNRLLRLEDADTLKQLQKFNSLSNIAGEAAIAYWQDIINDFSSHRVIYNQPLQSNDGQPIIYLRNFFGFSSIQDALRQMLFLQKKLNSKWSKFCQKIYCDSPTFFHDKLGVTVSLFKQRPIVSAVIMFPSQKEKIEGGIPNESSLVWVAPFAVGTTPQMLKGIEIDRSK